MATSGTYDFTLDIGDICEEAFERCGLEFRSAYDIVTARRSLDLLLTSWANRQVHLWTIEQEEIPLTEGVEEYDLPDATVDLLDAVIRNSQGTDTPTERLSIRQYLERANKNDQGLPTQFTTMRKGDTQSIKLYPVPPDDEHTLIYYRMRYVQDTGNMQSHPDVPRRFLPALISGLAFYIAQKKPSRQIQDPQTGQISQVGGVSSNRRQELFQLAEADLQQALDEDRERASLFVVPCVGR
jgi:hypothetical protein